MYLDRYRHRKVGFWNFSKDSMVCAKLVPEPLPVLLQDLLASGQLRMRQEEIQPPSQIQGFGVVGRQDERKVHLIAQRGFGNLHLHPKRCILERLDDISSLGISKTQQKWPNHGVRIAATSYALHHWV